MIKAKFITAWVGIFLLTAVMSPAAEQGDNSGKTLFESNCGKCHGLDRAKSKKKTKEEWTSTVLRMKKHGAAISDSEAELISRYLSETYK